MTSQTHQPIATGYVRTDSGEYLVQLPDATPFGFSLADDDQTWPGGIGVASTWQIVQASEVPTADQDRLSFLLDAQEGR